MNPKRKKHLPNVDLTSTEGRGKIPWSAPPSDRVTFSFKHLDLISNQKFSLDQCADSRRYTGKLLERLKAINSMTVQELRNPTNRNALRCHPIAWQNTSELGFPVNRRLQEHEPMQFEISANEHGRVHGFFIGNTFFIVWLDPGHLLYGTG
jgi:hypothetical protein